jgi:phosphoglycerate dehydrogenase-like enzyme
MTEKLHILLNAADKKFTFSKADFETLHRQHPDIELQFLNSEAELIETLPDIVWLDTWAFAANWYASAPNLKGIFTPAAGKEYVAADPVQRVPVYHGTFHGKLMAQSALAMVLHFSLNLHHYQDQQRQKVWRRLPARLLGNQSALIVGYGHIGRQCGQLLADHGMQVWGHQRLPKTEYDGPVTLISQQQLNEFLPKADHVISFLPGGKDTRHFFSPDRLGLLAPEAFLYNFGRGTTIDEPALLDALQNQRIAGAGLDVTEVEPLPSNSALWQHPSVLLMPHASAYYEEYRQLHVTELTEIIISTLSRKS